MPFTVLSATLKVISKVINVRTARVLLMPGFHCRSFTTLIASSVQPAPNTFSDVIFDIRPLGSTTNLSFTTPGRCPPFAGHCSSPDTACLNAASGYFRLLVIKVLKLQSRLEKTGVGDRVISEIEYILSLLSTGSYG